MHLKEITRVFLGDSVVKNLPANAGDIGLIPDQTCHGATKPLPHHYWACTWVWELQLLKCVHLTVCAPQQEKPSQWDAHTP